MFPFMTKHYSLIHLCTAYLQLQGCLNQDIDSFETERSSLSSLAEEGRSVVVMVRLGGVNTGDSMSPHSGVPPRHHGHHGGALLGQAPHGDPGPEAGLRLPGPHPRTPASLPAQVRGSQVTGYRLELLSFNCKMY